jgi:hypothetical protein
MAWCANRGSVSQVQAAREIADITAAIAEWQSPLWVTENSERDRLTRRNTHHGFGKRIWKDS